MAGRNGNTESMWGLSLWALGYAVGRWPAASAVVATMLVKIGMDVLRPWPMKLLVDNVLQQQPLPESVATVVEALPGTSTSQGVLFWCIAATVILFLLGWMLALATSLASIGLGQRMTYDLAADLFNHLQRLSLRFHSRKPVGDTIRRVTTDCGCVATIVKDALLPVLASTVTLVVMFLVMWQLDPLLTILSLAVVPHMVFVFRRYADAMLQRSYEQQEVEGNMYSVVEQTLSSMPAVQAFGREPQADERFQQSTWDALRAALATANVQLRFKIFMGMATAAGTAAILWIGATRVLDGHLSIGSILVFLSYLASLYAPLEAVMYTSSTLQGAAGSARRVLEILDIEHEVTDRPGAPPLRPAAGHIRLENVTFGYEPDRPVLQGVSMDVHPGQTIAIVGSTGAGKTTLVSLVPRFFDAWDGRVLIDGQDVREVQLRTLRRQVGLVLQEPFLFPLTIAENIAYGRPDATRQEIEAAARDANALAFIERLPDGYDTRVGERGATLSGGERQRISIARAFLKNAPILILDEPTSALDAATEAMLLEALRRLMKGRTTLIIAHRLSTVRHADRIIVVHHGRIVESGAHEELLLLGGRYAHFHAMQNGLTMATSDP